MKALVIYLNGRPTVLLAARGLSKKGAFVRARKNEDPHHFLIDETDPKGRLRAQAKAAAAIRHMRCLRRMLVKIDQTSWAREIPNVRRACAGMRPRHGGSLQWRIKLKEFPSSIPEQQQKQIAQ